MKDHMSHVRVGQMPKGAETPKSAVSRDPGAPPRMISDKTVRLEGMPKGTGAR